MSVSPSYHDSSHLKPSVPRPSVGRMGSLTRQLQDKEGPVWRFLAGKLHPDGVKAIRLEAKPQLVAARTILSTPMPSWEHGLVGTAFDYRLRYALAIMPANKLVAALGVRRLAIPTVALDDLDLDKGGGGSAEKATLSSTAHRPLTWSLTSREPSWPGSTHPSRR